jgi:adenylate cyclase
VASTDATLTADLEAMLRRGDLFTAFDVGRRAVDAGNQDKGVRYNVVLALARSGASGDALLEYDRLGLGQEDDVDCASLRARILKDIAFEKVPADEPGLAMAAAAYEAVFLKTGHYFPGINAASMFLLAGDAVRSRAIAISLLEHPEIVAAADYYAAATKGEAFAVLSRFEESLAAFSLARTLLGENFGSLSTTFTQIRRLLARLSPAPTVRDGLLEALKPPTTVHFHGGRQDIDAAAEAALAVEIADALAQENVRFGFGMLASNGDVLIAEQLIARGAELNVVLPYDGDENSLSPAGFNERKRRVFEKAASVLRATEEQDLGDGSQLDYADMIAMGLARMRADHLCGDCVQVGLNSEAAATGERVVAAWARMGGRVRTIDVPRREKPTTRNTPVVSAEGREIRALLFADFREFTKLPERQFPDFWNVILADIARLLTEHKSAILYRNTWGDAFFVVLLDAAAAAELAMSIQENLKVIQRDRPHKLELRIGLHHGPVYRGWDPVCEQTNFYGAQVIKAARAEPIAPSGEVIVTEALAAMLAFTGNRRFSCNYVGQIKFPKGYGEHRMYRLSRRTEQN